MPPCINRVGQRFGRLLVLDRAGYDGHFATWNCRCDCGKLCVVKSNYLQKGSTKSCGCGRSGPGSRPWYRSPVPPGQNARRLIQSRYRVAARIRGVVWELTEAEFDTLTQQPCIYCGAPPSKVCQPTRNGSFTWNGLDRFDNTLGYTSDNTVTCCATCNHAKRDMTFEQFITWVERVAAHCGMRISP